MHDVDAESLLQRFAAADPSRNKSATQWLVFTYIAGGFLLEDLPKARDTLVAFAQHRKRLPAPERDLGRYRTLANLWKAVKPFVGEEAPPPASGREARRHDRTRARAESEILFEGDDGFIVAVPMTEFAARWWGRGTRWCTAADRNNAFDGYHKSGPLIVIVLPGGRKMQLHVTDDLVQLMDEDDSPVSNDVVEHWWRLVGFVFRWAVKQSGLALREVPVRHRDRETCFTAVRQNGMAFRYVPLQLQQGDREIHFEAVGREGIVLSWIPIQCHDHTLFLEAVRQNGLALEHIDPDKLDREICLEAIRQTGYALYHVPFAFLDREFCLEAVKRSGGALKHVPVSHRDRALCLEAVRQEGMALSDVPMELRDRGLCLEAIKQAGNALDHVPDKLRDRSMCLEAVRSRQNTYSLTAVPDRLLDREICFEAVRSNGHSIRSVPDGMISDGLCLEAVRENGEALNGVPQHMRSPAICMEAVMGDGYALKYTPEGLRTYDLCLAAVTREPNALKFVPEKFRKDLRAVVGDQREWTKEILDDLRECLAAAADTRRSPLMIADAADHIGTDFQSDSLTCS